ncbi:MAG TPA: hypothetical protein VGP67_04375 [Gaiellales bacterium]|jgi:hypothetical protein|nr:hypothetical protein [Gaiellales bacterium]
MTRKLRWLVAFLALAAMMVAGTASAAAAPTVRLDGVRTTLWTDPATTKVLLANKIVPLPTYGTHVDIKGTAQGPSIGYGFPISRGRVDAATLAGHINHTGGLRFVNLANGKQLSLTNFRIVIDAHPHLTAIVNGDPKVRVSILRLDLSKATVSKPLPYVRVGNVGAYLNSTAAGALNSALGVSFFAPGIKLGTAYVNAHVAG